MMEQEMEFDFLTQYGPWGGLIAALAVLANKWLSGKKIQYRLKKIQEIANSTAPPEQKQAEIVARLKYWAEDDAI